MNVSRWRFGVLSVLAACLTGPVIAAPSGDPILIGVMGGTTGAYGNIGTQAQQGALLAQDKLMSQGGILGRPVVVEAVNDNGDGTLAGQLFQKFVSKARWRSSARRTMDRSRLSSPTDITSLILAWWMAEA